MFKVFPSFYMFIVLVLCYVKDFQFKPSITFLNMLTNYIILLTCPYNTFELEIKQNRNEGALKFLHNHTKLNEVYIF